MSMTELDRKTLAAINEKKFIEAKNRLLESIKNLPPEAQAPEPLSPPPLTIPYPVGYTFNNCPEFYEELRSAVESGQHFHFLFVGPTGSGKTYLAELIMNRLKEHYQWEQMQYLQCSNLYQKYLNIRNLSFDAREEKTKIYENLPHTKFIMDDLGAEQDTDGSRWFMSSLIDNDYRNIKEGIAKSSIITTNLTHTPLIERYGSRTWDRLQEHYKVFKFAPHSFRCQNRKGVTLGDQTEIKV